MINKSKINYINKLNNKLNIAIIQFEINHLSLLVNLYRKYTVHRWLLR